MARLTSTVTSISRCQSRNDWSARIGVKLIWGQSVATLIYNYLNFALSHEGVRPALCKARCSEDALLTLAGGTVKTRVDTMPCYAPAWQSTCLSTRAAFAYSWQQNFVISMNGLITKRQAEQPSTAQVAIRLFLTETLPEPELGA